jgi:alcohol dehydrogenase class IV
VASYECLDLERVLWGVPIADGLAAEVQRRGARRPLFVVSPSCRKALPLIDDWLSANQVVGVFDRIVPHIGRASVFDLVRTCVERDVDLFITVGGGAAIDTAKVALICLAAGLRDEAALDDLRLQASPDGSRSSPPVPPPPFRKIAAPTTLSGAEFSDLAGCTDPATQVKQLFSARGNWKRRRAVRA